MRSSAVVRRSLRATGLVLCSATLLVGAWVSSASATATTYSAASSMGATLVPGVDDAGNHCDDCTTPITLPFGYTLYGSAYTTANVSSNGDVQFVTTSNQTFGPIPYSQMGPTIFAYWSDLDTTDAGGGQGVFTTTLGSAPHRRFVVEWRTKACCSAGAPDHGFELILREDSSTFSVIIGAMAHDTLNMNAVAVQKGMTDFTIFERSTVFGVVVPGQRINFGVGTDVAAPSTTSSIDAAPAPWSAAPVPVTLTAADAMWGVDKTYYTTDGTTPTTSSAVYDAAAKPVLAAGQSIRYFSTDLAGNTETVRTSAAARVDGTPPTTADDVPSATQPGPVTVTLTATDATSGVDKTYYTTDGTTPGPTSSVYDAASKPTLSDGRRIMYYSVDVAGNANAVQSSATVKIEVPDVAEPASPTAPSQRQPRPFLYAPLPDVAIGRLNTTAAFDIALPAGTVTFNLSRSFVHTRTATAAGRRLLRIRLARTTIRVTTARTVHVVLRLSAFGRRVMARHPTARLVLRTTYVSPAGLRAHSARVVTRRHRA